MESPISTEILSKYLKDSLGSDAILRSFDAKEIVDGKGVVSKIYKLKLEWENSEKRDLPSTLFLKTTTAEKYVKEFEELDGYIQNEEQKTVMTEMVQMMHDTECELYNLFGTNPPILAPKCYGAFAGSKEEPGIILLEDLSDKAAILPSVLDRLNLPKTLIVAKEIARLHGWSLITPIDWKSNFPTFEEREKYSKSMPSHTIGFEKTKELFPEEFGDINVEKLSGLITRENLSEMKTEHLEFTEDVLVQGDIYMTNLMFEKNEDGTLSDRLAAIIDFQLCVRGSPIFDIIRLGLCVEHGIRKKHEDQILHEYYDEVKSIAHDKFRITYDQFKGIYKRMLALWTVYLIPSLGFTAQYLENKENGGNKERFKQIIKGVKADYDDAVIILGI